MFRLARAAAYAVASLVAFNAVDATPSFAWDSDAEILAAPYQEHADAEEETAPEDQAAVLDEPAAFDPNLHQDVVEHAVASTPEQTGVQEGKSLSDLVAAYLSSEVPDGEHECLAGAVYFESKGEPLEGQLAVAEVILNRASSGKYPTSLCGVVKQKSQFSFVRGGRIPPIAKSSEAWRKAVAIAHIAKRELADTGAKQALFFHARYVSPKWSKRPRVASIGNHIFYR